MHLTADNWLLSVGIFTPLAGVLIMLFATIDAPRPCGSSCRSRSRTVCGRERRGEWRRWLHREHGAAVVHELRRCGGVSGYGLVRARSFSYRRGAWPAEAAAYNRP